MAAQIVRLQKDARRALRSAFGKLRPQGKPVHVALPKGAAPVDGPDEVLVLVLGAHEGLALRRTVRGPMDLRELGLRLAGAEVAVEGLASEPVAPSPPLTGPEAALLDKAGLVEEEQRDRPGAFEKSRIAFELLLRSSITLERAAKALGVNPSRLRQRLAERTLFGVKDGRSWKLPTLQFDRKRKKLVRGIEKVLPHVREGAHPLAVAAWFSTPHQDLVLGEDEKRVTPLAWLASGHSSEEVAKLAEEI